MRILDGQGNTTTARSTASILETPASSGIYTATRTAPSTAGQYVIVWDDGTDYANEDLTVTDNSLVSVVSGDFTYDLATDTGKVRLIIGDTDSADPLLADDEIDYFLSEEGTVLKAAIRACDALAAKFSREYDFETDQQKFSRSQKAKAFHELATELRSKANSGLTVTSTTKVDGYSQDIAANEASSSDRSSGRVRAGYYDPDLPY